MSLKTWWQHRQGVFTSLVYSIFLRYLFLPSIPSIPLISSFISYKLGDKFNKRKYYSNPEIRKEDILLFNLYTYIYTLIPNNPKIALNLKTISESYGSLLVVTFLFTIELCCLLFKDLKHFQFSIFVSCIPYCRI